MFHCVSESYRYYCNKNIGSTLPCLKMHLPSINIHRRASSTRVFLHDSRYLGVVLLLSNFDLILRQFYHGSYLRVCSLEPDFLHLSWQSCCNIHAEVPDKTLVTYVWTSKLQQQEIMRHSGRIILESYQRKYMSQFMKSTCSTKRVLLVKYIMTSHYTSN